MKSRLRVLIAVGSGGIEPWTTIEREGQEKTFGADEVEGVEIVWLEADSRLDSSPLYKSLNKVLGRAYRHFDPRIPSYAGLKSPLLLLAKGIVRFVLGPSFRSRSVRITDRRVTFPYPSLHFLHVPRQIHYFRYVLENYDFDFLLKTTSTCFIDKRTLLDFVDSLAPERHYSGAVYSRFGNLFVSGAGALFSRDVVERIVRNERKLPLDYWEDVTIGRLIHDLRLADTLDHPRVDVPPAGEAKQLPLAESKKNQSFVYRCKAAVGYTTELGDEIERMIEISEAVADA